ncbi:MAG: ATP-dependent DNA helicase RecG [Lachnospiraceae bacterium]|nr:ATP-dependent DNA helicase RecG [Lachnospiraceae bacterium]
MELSEDITCLNGIGDKTAALFKRVGVCSLWDLLNHIPADYVRNPGLKKVKDIVPKERTAVKLTIEGSPDILRVRGLNILNVPAKDETGPVMLSWYNMPYLKKVLHPGMTRVFCGNADVRRNMLSLVQCRMYDPGEYEKQKDSLESVYHLTKGLTSKTVGKALKNVLKNASFPDDFLSEDERISLDMPPLSKCYEMIHFPKDLNEALYARRRLVFNEFYFFIRNIRRLKNNAKKSINSFPLIESALCARFIETLPYELTKAQKRTYEEIIKDLSSEHTMNRLVQGDVGSGKTVVALLAMLTVAGNGYQAALMAPTEVLAAQHMKNISGAVKELGVKCVLLSGAMTEKEKKTARKCIKDGEAALVIGTHALITDLVEFKNLALAITDEQHRFGVGQRKALAEKCSGKMPHVLVMSATPIPRTLAIILYGDLDISVMDELPKMRLPIKNCVVGRQYRPKAYKFIKDEIAAGHQAYVICPLVEESESSDCENVEDYSALLREKLGPDIRVGMLHGRMRPKDKDAVMNDFSAGNIDVLVSTTVVEVGVDVPNATVMLIEDAHMFGLSQLHQLRGRIGRGKDQSYCIFIDNSKSKEKNERLQIMNSTNDGFKVASEDLKTRGPGDIFGFRQSGELSFKIGDIFTDAPVLKLASEYADAHPVTEDGENDINDRKYGLAYLL